MMTIMLYISYWFPVCPHTIRKYYSLNHHNNNNNSYCTTMCLSGARTNLRFTCCYLGVIRFHSNMLLSIKLNFEICRHQVIHNPSYKCRGACPCLYLGLLLLMLGYDLCSSLELNGTYKYYYDGDRHQCTFSTFSTKATIMLLEIQPTFLNNENNCLTHLVS